MKSSTVLGALGVLIFVYAIGFQLQAAEAHSVILSTEEAQAVVKHQCSRSVPQGVTDFWVPTTQEIHKLEQNFKKCVRAQDVIDLMQLKRQYAGFLRQKSKFIYVNAGPNDSAPVTEVAMIVCDGGSNFFGFEYNVATQAFSEFRFNGREGHNPQGYESHIFSCSKK